jgi:hypothetical protein
MEPILTEGQKRWIAVAAAVLAAIFLFVAWQSRLGKGPASESESSAEQERIVALLNDGRVAALNGFEREIFAFKKIDGGQQLLNYAARLRERRVSVDARVLSLRERLEGFSCERSIFSIPWPWPKWDCLREKQELNLELISKKAEMDALERVLRQFEGHPVFSKLDQVRRSYTLRKQAEKSYSDSSQDLCKIFTGRESCKERIRVMAVRKAEFDRAKSVHESDLLGYRIAQEEFKSDLQRSAVEPFQKFKVSLESGVDELRNEVNNYWTGGLKKVLWELLVWLIVFGTFLKAMQAVLFYFWAPYVTRLSERSARSARAAESFAKSLGKQLSENESPGKPVLEMDSRVAKRFVVKPESIRSTSQDVTGCTSWKFPGLGFAGSLFSGLSSMVQLDLAEGNTLSLVSPAAEGELFLYAVPSGQALVIDIKHLVAIGLDANQLPEVRRRWHLRSFVAWALGNVRTFEIAGPCSLVFSCSRGTSARAVSGELRFSRNVVFAYSSNVLRGVSRTEAFMPYLRGRRALFSEVYAAPSGVVIEDGLRSGSVVRATSAVREGFFGKLLDPLLGLFGL